MDYFEISKALETTSTFDLYRLQVAIGHLLEEPKRLKAIRRRLKPGQEITYFDRGEKQVGSSQSDQAKNRPVYWWKQRRTGNGGISRSIGSTWRM